MRPADPKDVSRTNYERLCKSIARVGGSVGFPTTKSQTTAKHRRRMKPQEDLEASLDLAEIRLEAWEVYSAGRTLVILLATCLAALAASMLVIFGPRVGIITIVVAVLGPVIGREYLLSYPHRIARRRASEVMKSSSKTANLMIMSLRHEPSISRAMGFASRDQGRFARELKAGAWGVIMGRYASFEEALIGMGQRWSWFSDELKASLNAMVTASRESTEDGKRRALDRANNAIMGGAKRRIEEYALSLSMPSMVIFGLGILLPMMVGSFMPMLSWDVWSVDGLNQDRQVGASHDTTIQMVFVMNVLFPSIAILVAMNAISGHPFGRARRSAGAKGRVFVAGLLLAAMAAAAGTTASLLLLSGTVLLVSILFSLVMPVSAMLLLVGRGQGNVSGKSEGALEDALFMTGAGMLEGQNFESSLHKAGEEQSRQDSGPARVMSFRNTIMGQDSPGQGPPIDRTVLMNAREGLEITRMAATKDESAAGLLAMDLAAYLNDLRNLDIALKNRIKPTISMMKTTALLLAPVVLGVTYAIYLSLGSMTDDSATETGSGAFFLVLGLFLAEMDAIVVYYVHGIENSQNGSIAHAIGAYLAASEATFAATAILAST